MRVKGGLRVSGSIEAFSDEIRVVQPNGHGESFGELVVLDVYLMNSFEEGDVVGRWE